MKTNTQLDVWNSLVKIRATATDQFVKERAHKYLCQLKTASRIREAENWIIHLDSSILTSAGITI